MEINNQRRQIIAEFVLTFVMFVALLTAISTMAKHQREVSNKHKISKSVRTR